MSYVARSCLLELEASKSHLDTLLADTSSTLELLSSLSESFKAVELQTSTFQRQCEGLLSAQKRNSGLADDIRDNLQYYEFLDPASRKLNAPGAGRTVRSKEFSDMLRRLDECLDYMEAHVRVALRVHIRLQQLTVCSLSKRKPRHTALDTGYY
jgi:hypothetical protein